MFSSSAYIVRRGEDSVRKILDREVASTRHLNETAHLISFKINEEKTAGKNC